MSVAIGQNTRSVPDLGNIHRPVSVAILAETSSPITWRSRQVSRFLPADAGRFTVDGAGDYCLAAGCTKRTSVPDPMRGISLGCLKPVLDGICDGLGAGCDIEFIEDSLHMKSDGPLAHAENPGNLPIGFPVSHPLQDGFLTR